jgi:hypothetical protein
MNVLRAPLVLGFVGTLLFASCGGGGSDDPVALCKQGCAKQFSLCFADAGATAATFQSICESSCSSNTSVNQTKTCTNSSAIIAAYKTCLAKTTCDELTTCESALPDCAGGGTGGTSGGGTGGSSGGGTGGTSGGGTGGTSGGGTGGTSGGTGGFTGFDGSIPGFDGGISGTCADLMACCNATSAQLKPACMSAYSQIVSSGDLGCAIVFSGIKATYCPTL